MDEISCDNSRLRIPTYINDVYFLLVCCPFSWNAVYLRWNVISRVTATDTTGVTAIFTFHLTFFRRKESERCVERCFLLVFRYDAGFFLLLSFFFLFLSLSLFELKTRYSKITETGFRDYLVAGTEKTMETSDCVRETRRRLARQLSVPGTRNVRVEGNEFSCFC